MPVTSSLFGPIPFVLYLSIHCWPPDFYLLTVPAIVSSWWQLEGEVSPPGGMCTPDPCGPSTAWPFLFQPSRDTFLPPVLSPLGSAAHSPGRSWVSSMKQSVPLSLYSPSTRPPSDKKQLMQAHHLERRQCIWLVQPFPWARTWVLGVSSVILWRGHLHWFFLLRDPHSHFCRGP